MERIEANFTKDEIFNLNLFQQSAIMHPFTCNGHNIAECERESGISEGVLIATVDGWVCPCGQYTQNWAHSFMAEKKANKHLFLDDIREVEDAYELSKLAIFIQNKWDVVRNYNEFTQWITKNGLPEFVSFDHDLADIDNGVEKTGYDCALWLVDYCIENNVKSPSFFCHSMNPIGKQRINGLLGSFKYKG